MSNCDYKIITKVLVVLNAISNTSRNLDKPTYKQRKGKSSGNM
ncbi:6920_t:CDS:2 [Diversispora eburnea]|uniref:6920_t:CDS:1 n=1 Tax=Diversispora eburnea TaxID=1213867 RepID=A0A9N9C501_9GLOM|nr:6920_t:CDS:2 [Diversispora eburnea]